MMYSNKLAAAIKVDGKVLREFDDTVFLPFGSEYAFFIKNLHSVRAQVSISIDGEDITDGDTFVVEPNSSIDIERYLKGKSANNAGNRFKFIERTAAVEAHKGIGATDGLIRIEYQFERPVIRHQVEPYYNKDYRLDDTGYRPTFPYDGSTGDTRGLYNGVELTSDFMDQGDNEPRMNPMSTNSVSDSSRYRPRSGSSAVLRSRKSSMPANDVGVTVEGSISEQKFRTVEGFPVEDTKHVMVLKLLGETEDNVAVESAITTKTMIRCQSCGHQHKHNTRAKFCSQCGTHLEIVV